MTRTRRTNRGPPGLRIFQANVGRGGAAHDIALNLASEEGAEVIAIQEPWTMADLERRITKTHPSYTTFAPETTWSSRPRVMLYVRRGTDLQTTQPHAPTSPDVASVRLCGPRTPPLEIWNVYNAPSGAIRAGEGLQAILRQSPANNSIVLGDFNIRHREWDQMTSAAPGSGDELIDWATRFNLRIANPMDSPTHARGSTLDLVFSNNLNTLTTVSAELHTTSDHETLLTVVNGCLPGPPPPGRLRHKARDKDKFRALLQHATSTAFSDVQAEAQALVEAISTALEGSTPRSRESAKAAAWWTEGVRQARLAYRTAQAQGRSDYEKKEFRRAIRIAKRSYWHGKVEEAESLQEVYKITRWHKGVSAYQSPPLNRSDGSIATTPEEKAQLLRTSLLCRHTEATDIDPNTPAVPVRSIPWAPIAIEEAYNATCVTQTTAPGTDEITAEVIREAWPLLGNRITHLFQACTNSGTHPIAFKGATVVVLPKAGKRDKSSPKAYRPIALLSCLGKGLERLLARRISHLALKLQILAPDQCSATSKRSASDLTTALVCDIEKAWAQKKVVGIVTADVKGAFDGVLRGRLVSRLREQGWPENVLRWVNSFCSDRSACIRLDGTTSQTFPILCGLPQGSPISPILFLLYVEPFLKLSNRRFGYADDGCLFATGSTLLECQENLQKELDSTLRWGLENGISFDAAKTELQYFHRKNKNREEHPVLFGETVITPNEVTRWLGLLLDRKLTFSKHLQHAVTRAKRVTDHVQRLCTTVRGLQPALARQAMQACAFSTLFYGAETWYAKNTAKRATRQAQVAINRAARAILPVYKTTPVAALLRETGWGPAEAWLNRIHDRLAVRVASADPRHPLRRRWKSTRMRWICQRQDIQLAGDTLTAPWDNPDRTATKELIGAVGKEYGAAAFKDWERSRPRLDLTVFSDGAVARDGNAGAGFVVFRGDTQVVSTGHIPLGQTVEIEDAEVIGARAGLQAAMDSIMARTATNVTVCLDSEKVATALAVGRPLASSYTDYHDFQRLAATWNKRDRSLHANDGQIKIRWCPGHQGIKGNTQADLLAKEACTMSSNTTTVSVSKAKTLLRARYAATCQAHWNKNAPARYKDLGITLEKNSPKELQLPRAILGRLLAARSGHGDYAAYHTRFHHHDANISCQCGRDKAPEHFFFCRKGRQTARLQTPPNLTSHAAIKWVLSTQEGAVQLKDWCQNTRFFETICPNH